MSRFKFFEGDDKIETVKSVPLTDIEEKKIDTNYLRNARYRSEQQIITKHNGNVVSHGVLKHEYLLSIDDSQTDLNASVTITDAYGDYNPEMLKDLIQLGLLVDSVRHEQKFKLDNNGRPKELTNQAEMISNWMTLKTMQLKDGKFLTNFNSDEQKEILKEVNLYCDTVFSEKYPMMDELYKNLFHFTVFDCYLKTNEVSGKEKTPTEFYSNMFNLPITIEFVYNKVDDSEMTYSYEKESNLLHVDYDKIIQIYDQQYKPVLHYGFTDYIYKISSRIEVDKKTNLIKLAYATITESVKNNIENTIIYNLKQVDL